MPAMLDAVATAQRQSGSESTVFLDARGAGRGLRVSWNPDIKLEQLCDRCWRLVGPQLVEETESLLEG